VSVVAAVKRGGRRTEHGAAAVEFALVVPFLAMLILGLVTTAFTYSDHLSITNAVREGARYGASSMYSQAAPNPVITPSQWKTSVQQRVHEVYFNSGSDIAASDVCVQLVSSTGTVLTPAVSGACGTPPASPTGMTANSCTVKVWVHKPAHIMLVIAPTLNFNIGAESVSYYGRTAGSCTAD
jgi:Flp pilus assembly protein TadG